MNTESLVSVVVPTYNRAELVTGALDSIVNQLHRPLEIIVVDDGSTDDTARVLAKWEDAHKDRVGLLVKMIRQENLGGNAARNRGIEEASGAFVAFLDSDDKWQVSKIEQQLSVLHEDSSIGAVYCGVRHVDHEANRQTEPTVRAYPHGSILDQMLVKDVTAPTSTYLVRREVFDQIGMFDVELQARQDWDMWIRVASGYKIGSVPEALVDYQEHAGERTVSNPEKEVLAYQRIRQKYAHLLKQCSFPVRQEAAAAYYRRIGRVSFHYQHQPMRAVGNYLLAIINWPFEFDSYAALSGVVLPAGVRGKLHRAWNRRFGRTRLAIRSH